MYTKTIAAGLICCLTSALAWGGMFPVMGTALKDMDPFYFTGIRYVAAGLVFMFLLAIMEGKKSFRMEKNTWKLLFFGSAGFSGFGFLVFLGQKLSGPSGALFAAVIMALMPLMTVLVNGFLTKTRPPFVTVISILIALAGALLVITKGNFFQLISAGDKLLANVLILLGALCWVIYTLGGGQFPGWSSLRYTTLTTCIGSLTNIVIITTATMFGWLSFPTLSKVIAVGPELLYMVFIAGVVAVFTWNVGNKHLKPVNGVLFMNVVPVTTAIIRVMQGFEISLVQTGGILTVIAGLTLNNWIQRREAKLSVARAKTKMKPSPHTDG